MAAGLGVVWGARPILPIVLSLLATLALPFDPPSLRFLPATRLNNATNSSRTQWTLPVIVATMPASFRVMCKFYRATKNPSHSATTAQVQMSMLRRTLFESSTLNGISCFGMTRAKRPSQQRDSSAIDQRTRALLIKHTPVSY